MQKPGFLERIFEAKQEEPEVMIRVSEEAWKAYTGYLEMALDTFGESEARFVRDVVLGRRVSGGWHDSSVIGFSFFCADGDVGIELDVAGDGESTKVLYGNIIEWDFPGGELNYTVDRHELVMVGDAYQHTVYFIYPREPMRILARSIQLASL